MAALTSNLVSPKYFGRNLESTDGSVSMDSNDFGRESPNLDNASCCSDDTVLSVGNENPVVHQEENLSFKNIESHLNAISKITNSTLDPNNSSSIKSDPSSPNSHRLSPASTKSESPNFIYRNIEKSNPTSPESYDKFRQASVSSPLSPSSQKTTAYTSGPDSPQSPKLDSKPFYFRQNSTKNDNNNEPSNGNLKFSIDNILKADFGRRITDPINIRKVKPKKLVPEAPRRSFEQETVTSSGSAPAAAAAATAASSAVGGPVDLSKAEPEKKEGASGSSQPMLWPAWVYCTRYSDRPSSGRSPRTRRVKKPATGKTSPSAGSGGSAQTAAEEKRPRTAFSGAQLARLKHEFAENRYLTERRRQQLSAELGLNEAQIKIWFQNKRAKIKKASGQKNPLALQLMAQGLYNHSTIPLSKEEEELQELHNSKST